MRPMIFKREKIEKEILQSIAAKSMRAAEDIEMAHQYQDDVRKNARREKAALEDGNPPDCSLCRSFRDSQEGAQEMADKYRESARELYKEKAMLSAALEKAEINYWDIADYL